MATKKFTGLPAVVYGLFLTLTIFFSACAGNDDSASYNGWEKAMGNSNGNKYSSLTQIDTGNVSELQVAWEFHTQDADTAAHSQIQCNPIIVDGIMYFTSPTLKVFAIDAATGKEKWMYSPYDTITENKMGHFNLNNNRGVTYWSDGKDDKRIFYAAGPYIHCIDASTGKLVATFGNNGKVDLHDGLEIEGVKDLFVTETSPPSVYKDLIIAGTRVSECMDAAPGDIRAYDARTGKIAWQFHTIPHPGEPGYETWEDPNAWKTTGGIFGAHTRLEELIGFRRDDHVGDPRDPAGRLLKRPGPNNASGKVPRAMVPMPLPAA
jgi:quinoprotein glucose dehydrogenase